MQPAGKSQTVLEDVMGSGRDIRHLLTSGTLKAGAGFAHPADSTGLEGERSGVQEYVAESPFSYEKNCLLYLPKTLEHCRRGSREEAVMVADQIHSLICSTWRDIRWYCLPLTLMGSVLDFKRQCHFCGGSGRHLW